MRNYIIATFLAISLFVPGSVVLAGPRDRSTIDNAIDTLNDLQMSRERNIPPALLRDANAVVIAPDLVKGGFVIAARHGHGVLLVKDKNGGWSNPVFVTITGASLGVQAGVQKTDVFLVIRNQRSLERIMRGAGKLTLGADAAVAAGPVGRQVSADTDAMLRAEILSYSLNRGIFAGVALEGDTLRVDPAANDRFYGTREVSVADIVGGKVAAPESAVALRAKLSQWTAVKVEIVPPAPPAPLQLEPPILPKP